MPPQTIHVPPLDFRAAVGAVSNDDRTVELTFSTGAPVTRFDWMSGERYIEQLSMKPEHVRLDRLNSSAPLLNSHSSYDLGDQLGVVEEGSASVDGKRGRATVRFPKAEDDPDADRIFRKVKDKIIRNVSVGYRVYAFEETKGTKNELPVRTAIDWEPFEVSLVPMPADIGAGVRSHQIEMNRCVLIQGAPDISSRSDADRLRLLRLAKAATHPRKVRI